MTSRHSIFVAISACALALSSQHGALAMGYDSLACPELAERRIAYFVDNGFCPPGKAPDPSTVKPCKPIADKSVDELPDGDRTQVQMIIRTEARKSCPAK